jgi:hypothetical protein
MSPERVIGSISRECLDHLVTFNERHLRRVFTFYLAYCHRTRTHLSLDKDCPEQRPIQVPKVGKIITIPQVGGRAAIRAVWSNQIPNFVIH